MFSGESGIGAATGFSIGRPRCRFCPEILACDMPVFLFALLAVYLNTIYSDLVNRSRVVRPAGPPVEYNSRSRHGSMSKISWLACCWMVATLLATPVSTQEQSDYDDMLNFHLNCFALNSLLAFYRAELTVARQRAAAHHAGMANLLIEVSEHPSSFERLVRPKTEQAMQEYQDGAYSLDQVHSYVLDRCDRQRTADEAFLDAEAELE